MRRWKIEQLIQIFFRLFCQLWDVYAKSPYYIGASTCQNCLYMYRTYPQRKSSNMNKELLEIIYF